MNNPWATTVRNAVERYLDGLAGNNLADNASYLDRQISHLKAMRDHESVVDENPYIDSIEMLKFMWDQLSDKIHP